jgi:hemin uptake protein HemP
MPIHEPTDQPGRDRDDDETNDGRDPGAGTPATDEPGERAMNRRPVTTSAGADATKPVRRVRASDVLGPRGMLLIEHEGEVYTLRLTRNNRLILTK